ncbi:MAG: hypothetical protein Q4B26_20450, partial [Eubacteriales bacterium]|nr:hypothetical protein [Eubacteriales bacterium]
VDWDGDGMIDEYEQEVAREMGDYHSRPSKKRAGKWSKKTLRNWLIFCAIAGVIDAAPGFGFILLGGFLIFLYLEAN